MHLDDLRAALEGMAIDKGSAHRRALAARDHALAERYRIEAELILQILALIDNDPDP